MAIQTVPDINFPPGSATLYQAAFDGGAGGATSAPVVVGGAVTGTPQSWWILCPTNTAYNTPIDPRSVKIDYPVTTVTADQANNTVVASSPILAARIELEIYAFSLAERVAVTAPLFSGLPLRLVSVTGDFWDVRVVQGIGHAPQRWAPLPDEVTPVRNAAIYSVSFVQQILYPAA